MTLGELDRFFKSRKRVLEAEERKRASFDYIQADLIGLSIARVYNKQNKYPTIDKAYPTLFTKEEIQKVKLKQNQQRFLDGLKQFAHSRNKDLEKGGK